jgi:hypothetical protein
MCDLLMSPTALGTPGLGDEKISRPRFQNKVEFFSLAGIIATVTQTDNPF